MNTDRVTWGDRMRLRAATYQWKGRLVTCRRWALANHDNSRVCEMECNGRGYTVDYLEETEEGAGTILAFSSLPTLDLRHRRIYPSLGTEVIGDVLGWVNDGEKPVCGIDGGVVYVLDAWGNEVAV